MAVTPTVIVFDVNETLSDMSVMENRFADAGAPAKLAKLWFATLLREGFALAAAGDAARFADGTEAQAVLGPVLGPHPLAGTG